MNDQSTVELVDSILAEAIKLGASDIHYEAQRTFLRVRYRIDGVLHDRYSLPRDNMNQIIARLKILAHLDVAQHRVPQDGKLSVAYGQNQIDVRVSTFPGIYGEKIVLRLLDPAHALIAFEALGMSGAIQEQIRAIVHKQQGFFLVTGPTGSGKTTTLYATLSLINTPDKNITTLEDPVEYSVPGITQAQIHPAAGFTFANGIRAMLRQDPDVVLIGEIRDKESAKVAIEAALTGHLVLSTIHTNSAPGVVVRLMDMGIESFLVNAALSGVLAQRLVRMLCTKCRYTITPDAAQKGILKAIGSDANTIYASKGCDFCGGVGYRGRIGIFELLRITDPLRAIIVQNPSADEIDRFCTQQGMVRLRDDAREKVEAGIIALEEVARILL